MRTEMSQLLSQARSFVTRLKLTMQPAHAEARLDTRPVVRDPDGSVLIDPGTHELVVEASDYESVARNIRTDGGEALSISIKLRSNGEQGAREDQPVELEPTRVPIPPLEETLPGPQKVQLSEDSASPAPWIVIGASAAVAVAGGVLLAVALSNKHAVESPPTGGDGPHWSDYRSKYDAVVPLSATGIAALSLGAAGITAGLIWKLTEEPAPERAISVIPGGLSLHGQF